MYTFSSVFRLFFIIISFILVSANTLNAIELANDKFTSYSSSGYSRDDGWTNQLKIDGKKKSYKTYNLGSSYSNATLTITFQIKWKGGWESSGQYKDYFKVYFNGNEVVNDTFSGDASSWKNYSLTSTADSNGKFKIEFYANTTSSNEYVAIDNVKITTLDIVPPGSTSYHEGDVNFDLINPSDTQNIIGNTQIIGNTVECVTSSFRVTSSDYSNLDCSNDLNKNDNKYITRFLNSDTNASTFNSSSATFKVPATFKQIAWVGLYWQGHVNNYSYVSSTTNDIFNNPNSTFNGWDYYYTYDVYGYNVGTHYNVSNDLIDDDIKKTSANSVQLKVGNGAYTPITAESVNYYTRTSNANGNAKGVTYSAFANITDYFSSVQSLGNVDITVANILTTQGLELNLGNYGAWTIVIVYREDEQNPQSKLRNNSVYLGYKSIYNNHPADVHINNFLLPRSGTIDSQMAVFAAEGEYIYSPDTMSLDGIKLGNPDKNNVFDARLSDSIARLPKLTNNNGIDIDVFDTSSIMQDKRDTAPTATSYSSIINLTSGGDLYMPSMVSFTTELYRPRVCYYINTIKDSNGTIIFEDSKFKDGSEITSGHEYKFNFLIANMKKNSTDNNIEIAKLVQIYLNMTNIEYISSSTSIKNVAQSTYTPVTDIFADDLGEYDSNASTWRVGVGASSSQGGTLNISSGFTDTTHNAFVEMNGIVNVDGNATNIDLTDFLEFKASFQTDTITIGENNAQLIPQCQDQNTSIGVSAPSGAFNVVSSGFTGSSDPIDQANSLNALPTQVSARNFPVKVLSLDINSITLKPYTGDVTVSIINTPSFTGNASADAGLCKAGSPINTPQTITFSGENSKSVMIINTSDASKSASFQIISDLSGTPVYTCSRDVFAIRPEKFILTAPAGEDIELLTSAQNYNLSLKAVQNGTTTAVNNYNVPTVNSSTFNLKKTLYKPDGTADATLSGALSFLATSFSISNGKATNAAGINFNDVGKVNIQMVDKTWAQVDINNGDTVADCSATGAYICGNINAIFIPNSFALTTVSLFDNNITNSASTYLSNDLNMSAHVQLTATAKNKLNATTSNFKQGSWENPVDINIALVTPVTGMTLNKDDVNETLNLGFTGGVITIPWGETNSSKKMMFNFQRTVNTTKNPFRVLGSDVNVTASSLYTAPTSGNTKTVTGSVLADQNATFVYGRTNAPRQSFVGPNGNAFIYYEAYCNGTDATGAVCDKTLLPNGLNSKSTNDSRWFKNSFHVAPTDGKAGTVTQKDASGHVSVGALDNSVKGKTKVPLTYNLPREYPYETTMENNASRWLIYNQYKAGASKNEFQVEFLDAPGDWAGQHETNNTTKQNASNKTTRRVMW